MLLLILLLVLPAVANAQPAPLGTYRLAEECTLEVAPTAKDSVHVQVYCNHGPPGYHLGFLDEYLPIRENGVVYERQTGDQRCRITIRFENTRAIVAQHGSDIACGFGAFVSVNGTYRRTSRTRPTFDLNPVRP